MAVESFISPEEVAVDVSIPEAGLDEEFRNQAGLYAHYAVLNFKAMKQVSSKKVVLDVLEAELDKEIRDAAATAGEKITEAKIQAEITRDRKFTKATLEYNEANAQLELVRHVLRALEQKRDMLIQLGASAREEMKGELRMAARSDMIEKVKDIARVQ